MNSQATVQRFMILGSSRTGSTFLLSLLGAHPNIKTYGELFNLDRLPRESLLEALENPVMFLQRRVYEPCNPGIAAVGFKMFYDHLTEDYFKKPVHASETSLQLQQQFTQFSSFIECNYDWKTLCERFRTAWKFLHADRSLAVIHLKRRNMLHTLISIKTAFITNQWWDVTSTSPQRPTIHLHPDECSRYFCMLDTFTREADTAFSGHPKIDVLYEELTEKREDTMREIFALLRVPCAPVTSRMKKQNLAPPWETVDNYDELKKHFQHTRWGALFE